MCLSLLEGPEKYKREGSSTKPDMMDNEHKDFPEFSESSIFWLPMNMKICSLGFFQSFKGDWSSSLVASRTFLKLTACVYLPLWALEWPFHAEKHNFWITLGNWKWHFNALWKPSTCLRMSIKASDWKFQLEVMFSAWKWNHSAEAAAEMQPFWSSETPPEMSRRQLWSPLENAGEARSGSMWVQGILIEPDPQTEKMWVSKLYKGRHTSMVKNGEVGNSTLTMINQLFVDLASPTLLALLG